MFAYGWPVASQVATHRIYCTTPLFFLLPLSFPWSAFIHSSPRPKTHPIPFSFLPICASPVTGTSPATGNYIHRGEVANRGGFDAGKHCKN